MTLKSTRSERSQLRARKIRNRRILLVVMVFLVLSAIGYGVFSLLQPDPAGSLSGGVLLAQVEFFVKAAYPLTRFVLS